jgi:hypothetical protein
MKYSIAFFIFINVVFTQAQSVLITGNVNDTNGSLAYVSVYVKGTSNATLTNDLGYYELTVPSNSIIVYQYLGYETIHKKIGAVNTTIDLTLKEATFQINEIVVVADREDPSYSIIRKAIANKKKYRLKDQTYEVGLYVKGVVKIVDAPDAFMGMDIGTMEGIIDSNKQGILYLSETQSTILKNKSKEKEILHSSIVAGNDDGLGFNQFMEPHLDFYDDNIDLIRDMIGPLDDNAFTYYRYKLESTQVDTDGNLIHRIAVLPKSDYRPCFKGEISILDDGYRIHSLDLATDGKALKSTTFKSFRVRQVHSTVAKDDWRLLTQTMSFGLGVFAFKAEGSFNSVYSNYNLAPNFEGNTFNHITFEANEESIKNDTAFWNEQRPIALTDEEKLDYIKKDSLQRRWASKPYLDSIDRENNKFKLANIVFGYSYNNSFKHTSIGFDSPLQTVNFNAVEGFNLELHPNFSLNNPKSNQSWNLDGTFKYGFSDGQLKPYLESRHRYNKSNRSSWKIGFGRKISDYSSDPILPDFWNTYHSLFFKNNYTRLYQKDEIKLNWQTEITNGLQLGFSAEYNDRSKLENTSNYSFRHKEEIYVSNNPYDLDNFEWGFGSKKVSAKIGLVWNPGQKVMLYPNRKVRLNSDLPTLRFNLEYAPKINSDYVSYSKMLLSIKDEEVGTGIFGHLSYNVKAGMFLQKGGDFPDYFHFVGQEVFPKSSGKYMSSYRLLPYYLLDGEKAFVSGFFQQHLDGLLTDKIPLIRDLGWSFVVTANTLVRDDIQYIEPGIGLEAVKIAGIEIMRLDFNWGFDQSGYRNRGFRLGFINFIDDGVSL